MHEKEFKHAFDKFTVKKKIEDIVTQYKYRPLPQKVKESIYAFYAEHMNGFDKETKRPLTINGVLLAKNYNRVVVGDYGAFVEIEESDLLVKDFTVPARERWRLDQEYIKTHNLSIKYIWYQYGEVKVYKQLAGVKYADYQAGKYYIWVLDFDPI